MLQPDQKERLNAILLQDISASERRRVQLLLLYDQGLTTSEIANEVELSPSRVRYWRRAFEAKGFEIFPDLAQIDAPLEESKPLSEPAAQMDLDVSTPLPDAGLDEGTHPKVEAPEPLLPSEPLSIIALRELYTSDSRHTQYVRDMALYLFKETQHIHSLTDDQRSILDAAALLYDIAKDDDGKTDPNKSKALILAHPLVGFSLAEKLSIALVVGLQRGKLKFDREDAHGVLGLDQGQAFTLITLLRIAAALDTSQSQTTQVERLTQTPQALYVVVKGEHAAEDASAAQQAGKRWSKLFKHNLRVITEGYAEEILLVPGAIPFPELRKSPGVEPTDSIAEAGRKVLRYHFAEMLRHEEGTKKGEDIEELHDMRVAVRRMRVTFEIFKEAFDPKEIKPHLKGLRSVGGTLGRVRDLDVFMEKANHYLASLPEERRSGLIPLFTAWQDQRETARKRMIIFLESDEYRSFLHKFNTFVNTPGVGIRKGAEDYHVPHIVRHAAPIMINNRLGAVRAYDEILGAATLEQFHELRIEFKKLRYVVEFFREVLGPEAKAIVDELKGVQDHLGDLNDADVACQILSDFLEQWESRQQTIPLIERENPEPIVAYLAARHAERHQLMISFGETWGHFERPEFRRNLALAVAVM